MYLKRITVSGFKSFAHKTVLDLEPGISAIVGPNGSGKSNIADAIRWALGEQSKNRLRLGGRDEVVFGGTDKKARASYADVTLLFDNESGAFPLDLTEVEISRRLYRSGESDYRLAGRSVPLRDIQALMAEAGFGSGTYAVIGQGMIDSFLLSSPAERKLLFDEAAGIRASELKRETSIKQLEATSANLTRLRDINLELVPRLKSLEQSMSAGQAVKQLTADLRAAREAYGASALGALAIEATAATQLIDTLTLENDRLTAERAAAEMKQSEDLAAAETAAQARHHEEAKLAELLHTREELSVRQAGLKAQVSQNVPAWARHKELTRRLVSLERELTAAKTHHAEVTEEMADHRDTARKAENAVKTAGSAVAKAQAELLELRQSLSDGSQQQYISHALSLLKTIAMTLDTPGQDPEQLRLLVHKAGRLLSHATRSGEAQVLQQLKAAQMVLEAAMDKRETATEHQTNLTIKQRSLELDLAHHEGTAKRLTETLDLVTQELKSVAAQVEAGKEAEAELSKVSARLAKVESELETKRRLIDETHGVESDPRKIAEAAGRIERLRGRAETIARELEVARERLVVANAREAELGSQLTAWNISVTPSETPAPDPAALERQAFAIEAELAARQQHVSDTTSEYEEVSTRHAELATQVADLEAAEANLRQLIAELDNVIRERFKANFASLSNHFGSYFTRLFGGGSAALELEEAQDGGYGIQIKVNPKGKRLASLQALSGGERAMAGVALLAAILTVNPSPFVVLDEIDAALDEANSSRLSSILSDLERQSQLIVITHNRQTMKAAKSLFGVTMDEHHVSRLLSLRLEEATALAAR